MRKFLTITAIGALALMGSTAAIADHRPGHPKPKAAA